MTLEIRRIEAHVYRAPIDRPVATSFGVMTDRPAVFVGIEARDGAFGWGEVFANWPAAGAEHRARLLMEDVADLVLGRLFDGPEAMFAALEAETRIRAIQSAEPGPFAQVLAGLDTAAHDLAARRAGQPLARYLSHDAALSVPCYASGIASAGAEQEVERSRAVGFRAFKVKVGFDIHRDLEVLATLGAGLAPGETLMCDANQAWSLEMAETFSQEAAGIPLTWLEEPLAADAPEADWVRLAAAAPPLAAGENILGATRFHQSIATGHLSVVQPDVAKWGGITGCLEVARNARAAGLRYCPHFLGGGIGLIASGHLLAAVDPLGEGHGLLEVDVNPNPLREAFRGATPSGGMLGLSEAPGLGIAALPDDILPMRTLHLERTAA